jgi:hypothetical protein
MKPVKGVEIDQRKELSQRDSLQHLHPPKLGLRNLHIG